MEIVLLAFIGIPLWLIVHSVRRSHRRATMSATVAQHDFLDTLIEERRGARLIVAEYPPLDNLSVRDASMLIEDLLELPEKDY